MLGDYRGDILDWRLLRKPKIFAIEINDELINRDIGTLFYQTINTINDLIKTLQDKDLPGKEENAKSLMNIFMNLKVKTSKLQQDLQRIINIELDKNNYVTIRDDKFIADKLMQLQVMQEHLDTLLEILRENPTDEDFRKGLLNTMLQHLQSFFNAVDIMRRDDKELSKIYRALAEM